MAKGSIAVLVSLVYDAQAAWLEPALVESGLSWSQFQILCTVHGGRGEFSQSDVCRHLGLSPATISESLDSLVRNGLIERDGAGKDKRKKLLNLTAQGQAVTEALRKRAQDGERAMLRGVSEADLKTATGVLEQMVKNLP